MESAQARVQSAATAVYEELDKAVLRKIQVCIWPIEITLFNNHFAGFEQQNGGCVLMPPNHATLKQKSLTLCLFTEVEIH